MDKVSSQLERSWRWENSAHTYRQPGAPGRDGATTRKVPTGNINADLAPFFIHIACTNVSWILPPCPRSSPVSAETSMPTSVPTPVPMPTQGSTQQGHQPLSVLAAQYSPCAIGCMSHTIQIGEQNLLNSKTGNAKVSALGCAIIQIWKMPVTSQYFYKYLVMGANAIQRNLSQQ